MLLATATGGLATEELQKVIVETMQKSGELAASKGWEAEMMVGLIICMVLYFAFEKLMSNKREMRLAKRIDTLEEFAHGRLLQVVESTAIILKDVTDTLRALQQALHERLCLLDTNSQNSCVDRVADRMAERLADQFRKDKN
jgi:hypothetical protein